MNPNGKHMNLAPTRSMVVLLLVVAVIIVSAAITGKMKTGSSSEPGLPLQGNTDSAMLVKGPEDDYSSELSSVDSTGLLLFNASADTGDDSKLVENGAESTHAALEDRDIAAWLAARHSGLDIVQVGDPNREATGTLRKGHLTCDLGETPFRYHIQLLTAAGPMLLGEKDNRHKLNRSISVVREEDDALEIEREITVRYPRKAPNYGIVFRGGESMVETVGVIIPVIAVPEGWNPYDFQTEIRYGTSFLSFQKDDVMDLPVLRAVDDAVVLLGSNPDLKSAFHVLWFEFDDSGHLIPSKNDEK